MTGEKADQPSKPSRLSRYTNIIPLSQTTISPIVSSFPQIHPVYSIVETIKMPTAPANEGLPPHNSRVRVTTVHTVTRPTLLHHDFTAGSGQGRRHHHQQSRKQSPLLTDRIQHLPFPPAKTLPNPHRLKCHQQSNKTEGPQMSRQAVATRRRRKKKGRVNFPAAAVLLEIVVTAKPLLEITATEIAANFTVL